MISPIMEMYRNKKELKIDREHERLIALYLNSPISERKRKRHYTNILKIQRLQIKLLITCLRIWTAS